VYGLLLFEVGRGLAYAASRLRPALRRVIFVAMLGGLVAVVVIWRLRSGNALEDVRAARASFDAACKTVPAAIVHARFEEPVPGILVRSEIRQDRLNIQPINLAMAAELGFVEGCFVGGHCMRYENLHKARSTAGVNQGQIPSATARIRFAIADRRIVKDVHGARVVELKYEIADTQNNLRLAEATERVFDWGRWAGQRGNKRYGSELEACGYASKAPIDFRPNVFDMLEPYLSTDMALLHSALPRLQEAKAEQPPGPPTSATSPPPPPSAPEPARIASPVSTPRPPSNAEAIGLPAAASPAAPRPDYHGAVRLQPMMQGQLTEGGRTLGYCCAGAFAAALATAGAPQGRSYAEATFLAQDGSQNGGSYTNIGVSNDVVTGDRIGINLINAPFSAFPFPQGKTLRSGDTVGVLIDRDAGIVEFFRNGQSLRTVVLSGKTDGLRLWVTVSATNSNNRTGASDRWAVNFGTEPFLFPPAQALTYEGARINQPVAGR
jgi:hypothetical protein